MSELEIESDVDQDFYASIHWPKRVDPSDRQKILLIQFIEAWDLVQICFFSYSGPTGKLKHLAAWKKVWKHGLR